MDHDKWLLSIKIWSELHLNGTWSGPSCKRLLCKKILLLSKADSHAQQTWSTPYGHWVSQQPLPNQNICPVKDKKTIFFAYLFSFLVSLINCSKDKSIFCVCVKWKKRTKLSLIAPQMLGWNPLTEQRARQRNSGFKHHQEPADIIYTSTCLKGKQQTHSSYSEEALFFSAILSLKASSTTKFFLVSSRFPQSNLGDIRKEVSKGALSEGERNWSCKSIRMLLSLSVNLFHNSVLWQCCIFGINNLLQELKDSMKFMATMKWRSFCIKNLNEILTSWK